jgi:hypothetical protein
LYLDSLPLAANGVVAEWQPFEAGAS